MVCDTDSVRSSILRGPDDSSKILPSTTAAVFTLYAPPGVDRAYLLSAMQTLEARIHSFSPALQTIEATVYAAG